MALVDGTSEDVASRVQASKAALGKFLKGLPQQASSGAQAWNEGDDFKDKGPAWTEWGERTG